MSPNAVRAAPSRVQPDITTGFTPATVFMTTGGRWVITLHSRNPKEDFVMSIVPPASATLIWAFPTEFEEVRCFVWEHSPSGWSIAIMFGDETLALEVAPTRWAMETGVEMVWRGLLSSGIGKFASASNTLAAMSGASERAVTRDTRPPRFEDPFCPHTPFRHQDPSFEADGESSEPSPRRRPH